MLQILQLMDTWVDNGNFDEVLATMHPKFLVNMVCLYSVNFGYACNLGVLQGFGVEVLQQNVWSFVSYTGCNRKPDKSGTSLCLNRFVNHNVTGVIK
ncbi:unnamed protein product [Brassica rapa subsp. narinosa]